MFGMLFIFIINSGNIKIVNAEYSDNIKVDNIQEVQYENIIDYDGYKIYYAYNNTFHFLFIIAPFNFTNEIIEIRDQKDNVFCYFSSETEFSTPFLELEFGFINNTLEITINRIIKNDFAIKIGTYPYPFILKVDPDPKSAPQVVYTRSSDEEDKEKVDPVDDYISPWGIATITWMWMISNPILYILYPFFMTYIILVFVRTVFRPYTYYKNKKGKSKYLGRFAYQQPSEEFSGFWEIYFKRYRKMHKVYSKISYVDQIRFCYMNLGIVKYFSDIIYKKTELSDGMDVVYEQERVDTYYNKFKYTMYRVLSIIIYGVLVSKWLKNTLEYQVKTEKMNGELKKIDKKTGKKIYYQIDKLDEKGNPIPIRVKEIPLLQLQLSFDKIDITCDVEYDILETGEKGEVLVHKTEVGKSIYYVEDLKRDEKVRNGKDIKPDNYNVRVIQVFDIEQAIMQQDHIDNIRSINDLKVSRVNKEYIELDKKYNITREQLDSFNRNLNSEIMDKIKELQQKSVVDASSIVEIVSIALTGYKESGDVKESALVAFTEYYNKKGAEYIGNYKSKYEIEQAKANVFEKQVKQLQNRDTFLLPNSDELDADLGED